ncbi:asparaginase [Thermobifida halotolerans]|uniref:Asparaginase n=1 Tax=Thermobifida halotolerans TaxID=483545 RepID=A0AA97M356_9ACTN|nr:asparaginase [Thermobifida halotolerans]UOE18647.1 asparaginase [Thermobifida halotolerans]
MRTPPPPVRVPRHVPLVHLVRDGIVESVHHGSVVVLGPGGDVEFAAGDVEAACYPRSAFKPVQAAAMLRAGLPLRGGLLAVATASHSGEEQHITAARDILRQAGLTEDTLRTPADLPLDPWERSEWIASGRRPRPIVHNCSGKHAAMLLTSVRRGWSTDDYLDPRHPLQQAIAETAEELTGESVAGVSTDGCGAPLFAVSLLGLTRAIGRIGSAPASTGEGLLAEAMVRHPDMVSGTRRDNFGLMRAVPGLIAKDGFEAVQVAALPDGRAVGVKIADGSDRARMPATAAALAVCGVDPSLLTEFAEAPVLGGGRVVGRLRATGELAAAAETPSGHGVGRGGRQSSGRR